MNKEKQLKAVRDYVEEHGLDKGRTSNKSAWIRFYLFAYMKETFRGLSLADIGAVCDKDHSSVVYGIGKHNDWIHDDFAYQMTVRETAIQFPIEGQELKDVNSKLVTVELNPSEFKKLTMYRVANDFKSNTDAMKDLVKKIKINLN